LLEKAMRLNPFPPSHYLAFLGIAHLLLGDYEQAIQAFKKAIDKEPTNLFARTFLAATYAMSGREREGQAQAAEALRIDFSFSLDYIAKTLPFKDHAETERVVDALRKAGLK
jgi:adenylate cyclase